MNWEQLTQADVGTWYMCTVIDIRDIRTPGLETVCATHRMLGNRKQLMSIILVINGGLAK